MISIMIIRIDINEYWFVAINCLTRITGMADIIETKNIINK
jgi:hypothetical protein